MNHFEKTNWSIINRYHNDEGIDTDSAYRVYRSSPDRVTVQVRGPLRKKNGNESNYGIIASALLNKGELQRLRDAINASLKELE